MSQSQEWVGRATKKQIAANSHTATTIPTAILDTFWLPRCIGKAINEQLTLRLNQCKAGLCDKWNLES